MSRLPVALAASAAVCLTASAVASADSYTVFACKTPTGAPAPAAGWAADRQSDAFATNDCATGGSLAVGLTGTGPWTAGIGAEQRFTAPPNTRIASVVLARRTSGLAGAQHGLAYYLEADNRILDSCDPAAAKCTADLDGTLDIPNLDAGMVRFRAGCFESYPDQCTSNGTALRVDVPFVAVGLKDVLPPTVGNVQGTLTDPAAGGRGTLALSFDAADQGAGLYRVIVVADGAPVSTTNVAGGDCVDVAPKDNDPYEFVAAAPCPPALNGLSARLDTTRLKNGPHTVEVLVEDAAGNRTSVLPARPLTVGNPPGVTGSSVANGIGADVKGRLDVWFDSGHGHRLVNRYGHRAVVRGRLRNRRGHGIVGARIDVYHRLGRRLKLVKTGLKTRAHGKLTLILPLDLTTRDIVLAYRARRPGPVTSRRTLRLTVVDGAGHVVRHRPGPLGRKG